VSKAAPALGMTKIDHHECHMHQISEKVTKTCGPLPTQIQNHCVLKCEHDKLPYTNLKDRYHISSAQNYPLNIGEFLCDNAEDYALKVNV
jgi:hypothetical protein